jgi:lia operon protein LiaG
MSKRAKPPGWSILCAFAIVGLALVAAAQTPSAQQRERYTLTGDQVAIGNVAGELRVEPGTGSAVVVEIVRGGRDAGALKVKTGIRRGIPTLVVVYPGRRVVYPKIAGRWSTSQSVDDEGFFDSGSDFFGGHRITVSGGGSGVEAHANLRVLVPKGRKLIVHHMAGEARVHGLQGALVVDHGVGELDVRDVSGDVSLDTGSGNVTVAGIRGDLTVDTGSGPVTVTDVRGRVLALDTGSGEVRATGVQVDDLNADTGSGEVTLGRVRARRIALDTGSGDVHVDVAGDTRDIVVDSGSGSVTLRVPPDFGAEFDIETSSGPIEVDVKHESFEIGRDRVRGRIGDGHGRIRVDSGSGGVRILPGGAGGASGGVGMVGSLLTVGVG